MLKWNQTVSGAWAVLVVLDVELARLEVTARGWTMLAREGTSRTGPATSIEVAKASAVAALEELLTTALVDVRSAQHLSRPPVGYGPMR
jgi:hypothetical protein